jgi:hypothetical protein
MSGNEKLDLDGQMPVAYVMQTRAIAGEGEKKAGRKHQITVPASAFSPPPVKDGMML